MEMHLLEHCWPIGNSVNSYPKLEVYIDLYIFPLKTVC